jgi:hypothetical protein
MQAFLWRERDNADANGGASLEAHWHGGMPNRVYVDGRGVYDTDTGDRVEVTENDRHADLGFKLIYAHWNDGVRSGPSDDRYLVTQATGAFVRIREGSMIASVFHNPGGRYDVRRPAEHAAEPVTLAGATIRLQATVNGHAMLVLADGRVVRWETNRALVVEPAGWLAALIAGRRAVHAAVRMELAELDELERQLAAPAAVTDGERGIMPRRTGIVAT